MEMNGEQMLKKGKKMPTWIVIGYIICIIAIVGAAYVMNYREENQKPEAIDFTTDGAIGMATDQYAYLTVQGLTDEVAIYGDTENESDPSNDRYYIAISGGYLYIVDLDYDTIDQLKELQEYTYTTDVNATQPEAVVIYGMTEEVPTELKQMIIDYYNGSIDEEYQISIDQFDNYFGSVLLNARREPVDTFWETMIIIIAVIVIITIFIVNILWIIIRMRVKKYLNKNGYEDEIARQLDDNVEEKHYKDKVILTKDFFVDLKQMGMIAFKYSDIKWLHVHNVKYYGTITVSSSIIVHLKDGKTKFQCVEIIGDATEEFLDIFNKLCDKVPEDALRGYTQENVKAYKEYKKELKGKSDVQ